MSEESDISGENQNDLVTGRKPMEEMPMGRFWPKAETGRNTAFRL